MAAEIDGASLAAGNSTATTPSTTQFMNLANYMYQAYTTPYSSTPLQADIGFKPLTTRGGKDVVVLDNKTGLYAQAFVSTAAGRKQVVIAYEGTNIYGQTDNFTAAQIQDDSMILNGQNALSYRGSAAFAHKVLRIAHNNGIRKNEVFVTGHSLGAGEAQYAAARTGLGGVAFAGPGLPKGDIHRVSHLTNYVDAGDPVGNYAGDSELSQVILAESTSHFGKPTILTNNTTDNNNMAAQMLLQQANQAWSSLPPSGKLAVTELVADRNLVKHDFHSLNQYASDLDVTLYMTDGSSTAGLDFFPVGGSVTCFVTGSRIKTTRGEVAVEDLVVGDIAITSSGACRPIRWIGHRTLDCRRHTHAHEVMPVRIAAHAFGENRPSRDLLVSPGHAICIDVMGETLVPAGALVNGATVAQHEVDKITYWHVELDSHDILLAENLPTESYLEMGNRSFFGEAEMVALHARPDAKVATHADFCRPFVADGPILDAIRKRLREQAGRLSRPSSATGAAA